jgi:hypothetical protein
MSARRGGAGMFNRAWHYLTLIGEFFYPLVIKLKDWLAPEVIVAMTAVVAGIYVARVQHSWLKIQIADQFRARRLDEAAQTQTLRNTYLHIFRVVAYGLESLIVARRLVGTTSGEVGGEQASRLMEQVIAYLTPCGREMREFVFRPEIDLAASRVVSDGAHNLEFMLWAMSALRDEIDANAMALVAETLDKGIEDFWDRVSEVAKRLPPDLQAETREEVEFRTRSLTRYRDDLKRSAKGLDDFAAQLVALQPHASPTVAAKVGLAPTSQPTP